MGLRRHAWAVVLVGVLAGCTSGDGAPPVGSLPHDAEHIKFTAEDGTGLQGLLFGAGGTRGIPQTVIVMAHQRGGSTDDWTDLAVAAVERGHAALAFHFRGYGGGEGERDTALDVDLRAAVDAVRGRGFDQVFVVGASMGGTAALDVAADEELAGVAALSAPANFAGLEVQPERIDEPVMVVSAADDRPYSDDADLFDERITYSFAVKVNGNAHGTALFAAKPNLEEQLLDWIADVSR